MTESLRTDVAVVGGGPGGYVAAIRAAQLGKAVTLVEREALGGVCLNWGCIPTKALLHSADLYALFARAGEFGLAVDGVRADYPAVVARSRSIATRLSEGVAFLMKKNKVRVVTGNATLLAPDQVRVTDADGAETARIRAEHVILATGARTRDFPGMRIDGKRILGSRHVLTRETVPASIAILGAGSIGVEFAHLYQRFGAQVSLVELLPAVLPASDGDVSREIQKVFRKRKVNVLTGARVTALDVRDDGVQVVYERKGRDASLDVECVLMAVGVMPNVEGLGLEACGIGRTRTGITVDAYCRTSVETVYAIGDVAGPPCLAHKASAEAIVAAEHLTGHDPRPVDHTTIPACTYSSPQVAAVGYTEQAALEAGFQVRIGKYPLLANGRALAIGENAGFIKTILDAETDKLLGLHIVGPEASEMLQEAALARTLGATARDLLHAIHPHPTLSEGLHEAVAAALGEAIHL